MSIDGILNINKPEGNTSFSIVAWLKRLTGEKRIGHAGTLDPIATGVLPVCFGGGTRVIEFLMDGGKTYLAQIELGVATDTFDREGKVVQRGSPSGITATQIEGALAVFQGTIEQVPPIYSALKHHGRRCCDLARDGISVRLKPRRVEITSLELIDYQPPLITIKVACGKGTYIRSLAHDMGQYLGCGAYLKNLVRLQCGPFHIEEALSMSQIEEAFQQSTWMEFFHPVDSPLLSWRAAIVDKRDELAIKNGCPVSLGKEHFPLEKYCRAYSSDGHFIAILHFISERKLWHPKKVFSL